MKYGQGITFLPFTQVDYDRAMEKARRMGYGESTFYNTSADLPGLYCIPRYRHQREAVIISTAEFGLMVILTDDE